MALSEEDKHWLRQTFATKEDFERFATKEDLERTETNLLTAFYKWASPIEARLRSHTAAIQAIDAELAYHDDRLKRLEPPPATS